MARKRQQQLDQQATSSTSSKPKIKRKNLLHGCKLCPEKNFHVSAKSKVRPANPSVEGHVEKEHCGMNYLNLTKRWGYRIHYENGTIESIPLVDSDIEGKKTVEPAKHSQEEQRGFNHFSSDLPTVHHTVENEHDESCSDMGSRLQAFLSASASYNNSNENGEVHHNFGQQLHANVVDETNAPSACSGLPILNLGKSEVESGSVLGPQSSGNSACTNGLNHAFSQDRVGSLSPFDRNDPFGVSVDTPIDPRLTCQEELIHDISSADCEQAQGKATLGIAGDDQVLSNQCGRLPDRTRMTDAVEDLLATGRYQDQIDGQGSSLPTPSHDATQPELHKGIMNQDCLRHDLHDSDVSVRISPTSFHTFDLPKTIQDNRTQPPLPASEQISSFSKSQADTSSPGSLRNGHGTFHQYPSPFKIPATPASATRPVTKRSRSSQSLAKQYGTIAQPKTPSPSPQKRKVITFHPQTPTPKSRRSNSGRSKPVAPQISPISQPQKCSTPVPDYSTLPQTEGTSVPLQWHSTGPLVFPQVSFSELHDLDREALTGYHGQYVANLARLAFFGNDAVHDTHSRTRETQLMDMIGYLRLQREVLCSQGGNHGGFDGDRGMGSGT